MASDTGPSSPDDSFSSPIGNTLSSPDNIAAWGTGAAAAARRILHSLSLATTPPAHRSRFAATSETTPTPSRTHRQASGGANGRPFAASTPSSTDDAPPSSECGDGYTRGNWIGSLKSRGSGSISMLRIFTTMIRICIIRWRDIHLEVLAIFEIVLMDMASMRNPLFEKHIQARIFNLRTSTCMRNLNPSDIEKMVSLKGMIIRCSSVIPEIREAVFRCLICGYYSDPVRVERGRISEPKRCMKEECATKNSMTLVHNRRSFTD